MFSKLPDGERGGVGASAGADVRVQRARKRARAHLRAAARLVRARPAQSRPAAGLRSRRISDDQAPHRRTHENQTRQRIRHREKLNRFRGEAVERQVQRRARAGPVGRHRRMEPGHLGRRHAHVERGRRERGG